MPTTRSTRSTRSIRSIRTALVAGAVAVATAAAPLLAAAPSSAARPGLELVYDVHGSTTLTNPNSKVTVTFAPTTLDSTIYLDHTPGVVKATMPLAPVRAGFRAYGFLPTKGTVVFTQVKPVSGLLDLGKPKHSLTATALYVVSLRDVKIGGHNAHVGSNCQTIRPVKVAVASKPDFAALTSGTFVGTYDLGRFQDCGTATSFVNDTLPGDDNTLKLKVALHDDDADRSARSAVLEQRPTSS